MKSGDGGVDLIVWRKDCVVFIQCKDHADKIGTSTTLSGVLLKRSKRYFGIVVVPKVAEGAVHEANTSPRPLILSYEDTIVQDLWMLIRSRLEALKVEENEIVTRMKSEMEGVVESWQLVIERRELEAGNELMRAQMKNAMMTRANELLMRENEELATFPFANGAMDHTPLIPFTPLDVNGMLHCQQPACLESMEPMEYKLHHSIPLNSE
ncbi:74_t:CDS:2 [Paraglomus occultum]|uniref:74_t:CDS:1 n=1 Tax=Paraglomus occultum TaxID=144539 RepID=A0A9N9GXU3_9GLOM|nr:74_t:CDS:2 [Paraglomus occultum]